MENDYIREGDQSGFSSAFHETQRMNQWWIWLIVGGGALWMWWGFYQQIALGNPFGNNPAPDWMMWPLLLFVGIVMPLGFGIMKLVVDVKVDRIYIRFHPFSAREILFSEIASFQARQYSPIREYGGWGVRGTRKSRKMAYNAKGNWGVDLELKDGRFVLIGSQRANELEDALTIAILD